VAGLQRDAWDGDVVLDLAALTLVDLLGRVENGDAIVQSAADEPVRRERFTMPDTGDWGDVLLLHPPAFVSMVLDLPQDPVRLISRVAMAPQSWEWGGDGATFVVTVKAGDAEPVELYHQHVTNEPIDRTWRPVSVSLGPYAGRAVTVTLATEPGPSGNTTGDWAGWDTPRILWQVP
jgi:hypothetical protein